MQLARFQRALRERGLDGALIAAPESMGGVNARYLSGFSGSSAYLLIGLENAWILVDFRYWEQAAIESPDFEVVHLDGQGIGNVIHLCKSQDIYCLGFEEDKVPVQIWRRWNEAIPVVWRPLERMVERLRLVKTTEEIALIREAAAIAGDSLMEILPNIVGQRETDVAFELEWAMRRRGAEALAFPTIVASGPRGSLPHAQPTSRVIQPGELVTLDFGARVSGYHSDETVTVATAQVSRELSHIYKVVAEAQAAGIAAVKPGNSPQEVDAAARAIIGAAGYGEAFGHGTGHGVGLEVHEDPYASPGVGDQVFEVGMTITVEPGIYLPGVGGVRLEDTLVVTESGCERLTRVPKHFRVI